MGWLPQPLFDLGRGSQPQAAVLDGLEQVGGVAGGGTVEQQKLLVYHQTGGQAAQPAQLRLIQMLEGVTVRGAVLGGVLADQLPVMVAQDVGPILRHQELERLFGPQRP